MPTLYLIPTPLGDVGLEQTLPQGSIDRVRPLRHFIVERAKTARHFLKQVQMSVPMETLDLVELNTKTDPNTYKELLRPALELGLDMGLLSEAGCPAVADPGAEIVRLAHAYNIEVVPLVGASSILLALMASGMSGQNFAFWGYLPIVPAERKKKLQALERMAQQQQQTQLFIETPYRNDAMLQDMIACLQPHTRIGIATDLTLPTQLIQCQTAKAWRAMSALPNLHRRPTVFSLMP
jgi:16S rRNA (cytidine1402-2'-O)-methyltransferase